jgi:hypothetical protein
MKKIIIVLGFALLLMSCNISDDRGTSFFASTIDGVTMPSAFKVDSTSQILVRYKRPSDCHIFNGFYHEAEQFTHKIAVRFVKMDYSSCEADQTVYEVPFHFKPAASGTYLLRFWNHRDANGMDTYIEEQAIVP